MKKKKNMKMRHKALCVRSSRLSDDPVQFWSFLTHNNKTKSNLLSPNYSNESKYNIKHLSRHIAL